jgi:hypothetical protein
VSTIYLTQLAVDAFQRPDESPLIHPPWTTDTFGQTGLRIISHLAQGITAFTDNTEIYTGQVLPNNQYASATLGAGIAGNANLVLGVRMTDTGTAALSSPTYFCRIAGTGNGGGWTIEDGTAGVLATGTGLTVNSGDFFTLAIIGAILYLFQNGVQINSVGSAGTHTSGSAMLVCATNASTSSVQVSAFACGKASLTPGGGNAVGYSTPDCRVSPFGPNMGIAQSDGSVFYVGQSSSNPAVPGADSRAAGAPVDSRAAGAPVNSRVAPK